MNKEGKILHNVNDLTYIDVFNIAMHKGVCNPNNVLEWRPHETILCAITIFIVDGSKVIFIPTLEQLLEVANKKALQSVPTPKVEDEEVEEKEPTVEEKPVVEEVKEEPKLEVKVAKHRGRPRKNPLPQEPEKKEIGLRGIYPFESKVDFDLLVNEGRIVLTEKEFRHILKNNYDSTIEMHNNSGSPLTDTLCSLVEKFSNDIKANIGIIVSIVPERKIESGDYYVYVVEKKGE